MAHDVFISYSHKNKTAADAVCAVLESKGIRCWVAPRDILPSADWSESIMDAIVETKAMVLILSRDSNESQQVRNEVMAAVTNGKNVLPFLIENVEPAKGLKFQIARFHWLNAFDPPLQRHIEELASSLNRLYPGQFHPPHNSIATEATVPPNVSPSAEVSEKCIAISVLEKRLVLDLGHGVNLELLMIPPGTFEMGSPESEMDRSSDEQQHTVVISEAFYIGKFAVTQEQYEALTGKAPSTSKGAKNPVEKVNRSDAQGFCKALQTKFQAVLPNGIQFHLPTEAQWEYACRAGTTTRFYSGDAGSDLDSVAWHFNNSDSKTHPVGQKAPNAFGLYDMHGNVWEWCRDAYLERYETLQQNNPFNAQGDNGVLRGGCWRVNVSDCRSANRNLMNPGIGVSSTGFRIVASTPPPTNS